MIAAAQSPVDLTLPETGSSEDMPWMFGPLTLPQTASPIPPPPVITPTPAPIPAPSTPPPPPQHSMPVPAPVQQQVYAPTPTVTPVSPRPTVPTTPHPMQTSGSPFPPAPAPPRTVAMNMTYPAAPQLDVRPAEARAAAQAQLPYTMSGMTMPKPALPVPVAVSTSGGNILKVTKEEPVWVKMLLKVVMTVVAVGLGGGLLYGGFVYWQTQSPNLPGLPTMSFETSWLMPGLLLGVGLVFMTVGYFIQKAHDD
jgi:hypothetical protein